MKEMTKLRLILLVMAGLHMILILTGFFISTYYKFLQGLSSILIVGNFFFLIINGIIMGMSLAMEYTK